MRNVNMGGKSSKSKPKPTIYPPLDPFFISIGCTGFLYRNYNDEFQGQLKKAPFLNYQFTADNYSDLLIKIRALLVSLPIKPEDVKQDPPSKAVLVYNHPTGAPDDNHALYGPVFLLVARNRDSNKIDAYMYLPSMRKNGKPWSSYEMLNYNHRWMYLLMYSKLFRVKPGTNCFYRTGEPDYSTYGYSRHNVDLTNPSLSEYLKNSSNADIGSLMLGCATTTSENKCIQSEAVHRAMGIYDSSKNATFNSEKPGEYGYPFVYFRNYKINAKDSRVRDLFNQNSFTGLQLNTIVAGYDTLSGCGNMIISRNYKYFMILEESRLAIYRNLHGEGIISKCNDNIDPRKGSFLINSTRFAGKFNTRMIIEGAFLKIYSKVSMDKQEILVLTVNIAKDGAAQPIVLILDDYGRLVVTDKDGNNVSSDNLNSLTPVGTTTQDEERYNAAEDHRKRMLNLNAYLRMKNMYREELEISETEEDSTAYESYPGYDPQLDYTSRLSELFNEYAARGVLDPSLQYVKKETPKAKSKMYDNIEDPQEEQLDSSQNVEDDFDRVTAQYEEEDKKKQRATEQQDAILKGELGLVADSPAAANGPSMFDTPQSSSTSAVTTSDQPASSICNMSLTPEEKAYISSGKYSAEMDANVRAKMLYASYQKTYGNYECPQSTAGSGAPSWDPFAAGSL